MYFCVRHNKVITKKEYQKCMFCSNNSENYSSSEHGCWTQNIVGYQNDPFFELNMDNLVNKHRRDKLERILNNK